MFGGGKHDFVISDCANANNYSSANVCSSYYNKSYKYDQDRSNDKFSGGKYFVVK